jgi:hypothetical protein
MGGHAREQALDVGSEDFFSGHLFLQSGRGTVI